MKARKLIITILAVMVAAGATGGAYYWYQESHYVTTEDARVTGEIYAVSPSTTGRLEEWRVKVGDRVSAGEILGRLEGSPLVAQAAASPSGRGNGGLPDLSVIKAPISGTIIDTQARAGEVVTPGLPLAMMVDLDALYVTANVPETRLRRLRVGQQVQVTVDALPASALSGQVESIGLATTSTFSLLPAGNPNGVYNKVTQKIPVKIRLKDLTGKGLLPGLNATVRIKLD